METVCGILMQEQILQWEMRIFMEEAAKENLLKIRLSAARYLSG